MKSFFTAATAAFIAVLLSHPAEAKHYKHHHYRHSVQHERHLHKRLETGERAFYQAPTVVDTAEADQRYTGYSTAGYVRTETKQRFQSRRSEREDVVYIPNPPGTWRVFKSCAHRLAAYWNLGKGLDAVETWPHVFARALGPGVGVAWVRNDRHHVLGIVGGGPGAWRVVDFNSGDHLNREYTVSDFRGGFFVDTRTRTAMR